MCVGQEARKKKRAEHEENYKFGMPEIVHGAFKDAKVERYLEEAARVLKLKYQVGHKWKKNRRGGDAVMCVSAS